MSIAKQLLSSRDQTWATPVEYFNRLDAIFNFRLDPCCAVETAKCPIFYTKEDDGLKQAWHETGNTYVNPPFGRELPKWMRKCKEEAENGITVVMLIPARVDTSYWHEYAFKSASYVCFVKGRIKFELHGTDTPKDEWVSAPFPNAIIVFGACSELQAKHLDQFGKVFRVSADNQPYTNKGDSR